MKDCDICGGPAPTSPDDSSHDDCVIQGNGFHAATCDCRDCYEDQPDEGPYCSICDGLGHGYPGGRPCPLEERGAEDSWMEAAYEDQFAY